jgi:hypothetical protein
VVDLYFKAGSSSNTMTFRFFAVQRALSRKRMQHRGASPLLIAARFLSMGFTTSVAVVILQKTPLTVIPSALAVVWRRFPRRGEGTHDSLCQGNHFLLGTTLPGLHHRYDG